MSPLTWIIALVVLFFVALVSRRRLGIGRAVLAGLLVAGVAGSLAQFVARRFGTPALVAMSPAQIATLVPAEVPAAGYVSSQSCAECHSAQHASWSASYHRTITQLPSEAAIQPEFAGELQLRGEQYRLGQSNGQYRAEFADPDEEGPGPHSRIERPIALVTGSHHLQLFWYPIGIPRVLGQLPVYFHLGERRWIPASASLLAPHSTETESLSGQWNTNCLRCHATFGRPRPVKNQDRLELDTLVAEFGVSCEACHGPAERHVELRRKHRDSATPPADDPIINPSRLDHRRAAEVCGFCHSYNSQVTSDLRRKENEEGPLFRPGDEFTKTLRLIRLDAENQREVKLADLKPEEYFPQRFWSDGMVRTGGHEFNGLYESACFQKGSLSCLNCHDMHQKPNDARPAAEWANGQLSLAGLTDTGCLACHESSQYAGAEHTHHAADSIGARCVNCHMPHTSYGLLRAQRSHQISSPRLAEQLSTTRPNACSLCHLDKPLGWTADRLRDWYGHPRPALDSDKEQIAEGVRLALTGDAGLRALAAWHMGWETSRATSGHDWMAPVLTQLLLDPYDAVRFIAGRSVRSIPEFEEIDYDFVAPQSQLSDQAKAVLKRWRAQNRNAAPGRSPVLLDDSGEFLDTEMSRLLRLRDRATIELVE
ncbi:MAG: hypothetical protein EHM42_00380 [Planctomycetaceae bacterium]|nr:MAG: hypothetical protein EHM42_00380 [Planctomycetaceae bacterium]